jgi:hypothetical protein
LIRRGFRDNCGEKSWAIGHNSNPDQFSGIHDVLRRGGMQSVTEIISCLRHVSLHRFASMHKPVVLRLIFARPRNTVK